MQLMAAVEDRKRIAHFFNSEEKAEDGEKEQGW